MALVVVNQGEEAFLDLLLAVNYTLHLYKNDVTDGLTQAEMDALTEADFQEADFAGYSSVALTGGSWTTTPGDPAVGSYAQQSFIRSSTGAVQNVYGYYITVTSGGALRWFERFGGSMGVQLELINDEIRVTPRITLKDEGD